MTNIGVDGLLKSYLCTYTLLFTWFRGTGARKCFRNCRICNIFCQTNSRSVKERMKRKGEKIIKMLGYGNSIYHVRNVPKKGCGKCWIGRWDGGVVLAIEESAMYIYV